jgi:hypothetical protein
MRKLLDAFIATFITPAMEAYTYSAGQIWAYKTRPSDRNSLLKIQQVENHPTLGPVYHISIIGIHLSDATAGSQIDHSPVSQATLDMSTTHLVKSDVVFPDPAPGIAQWRNANGGIFTISVAEIVDFVDQQTARHSD